MRSRNSTSDSNRKKMKSLFQRDISTPCSLQHYLQQSKHCSWIDEWIKKMWYGQIQIHKLNRLIYEDDTTLMAENEKELKSSLMSVKDESEKVGLKLNIQKMKIMAFVPITSWQIHGETMETVRNFIFLGSKITADGDCIHEIKRCLLLGRKVVINLDTILKSRVITLLTKFCLAKAIVFLLVMYEYESWTIKKVEC